MASPKLFGVSLGALLLLGVTGTGCATKKHVAKVVAPVEQRVGEVEKQNQDQQARLGELGNEVSRADERAMDAEKKASAAGQAAAQAGEAAGQARQRADGAYGLAEQTQTRLGEVQQNVDRTFGNLDNYRLVTEDKIYFGFDRSVLTKEAKADLDSIAGSFGNMQNFVVEVQGYTDHTGSSNYNIDLSQKRASAVVRYLATEHNVPLRRISVLGVGEAPTPGKTRAERKENRRVDVKVYALDLKGEGANMESRTKPPAQQQ